MDDPREPKDAANPPAKPPSTREAKLVAALRDNLRRRKQAPPAPPRRD